MIRPSSRAAFSAACFLGPDFRPESTWQLELEAKLFHFQFIRLGEGNNAGRGE
jgi:hypothetical protein